MTSDADMLRSSSMGAGRVRSYSAATAASARSRIIASLAGDARNAALERATCGKVVPNPSRSPSPGASSAMRAWPVTHSRSDRVHGAERARRTAARSEIAVAQDGTLDAYAVDVTKAPSDVSNHSA